MALTSAGVVSGVQRIMTTCRNISRSPRGVELGDELLRCDLTVGVGADLRHLVPVGVDVEATPSQPRPPTYGGRKNRSGSCSTSWACVPGGAAHQMASRPSWWWSSRNITNVFLSRTKNVGDPWLGRSVTAGRSRQMRRISASAAAAVASLYTVAVSRVRPVR